ncbi:transposase [bacterium BRH_c32]|jgi:transposase InsO family protein|nr:MAG: transposase [bacterium BRH_c32]
MSGKGNCYDNAITETFFSTFKKELIYLEEFKTREKLMSSVFEFIEVYYNRQRLHSSLGYLSPVDFVKGNLKEKQELLNSKVA